MIIMNTKNVKLVFLFTFMLMAASNLFAQFPKNSYSLSGKWLLTWADGTHGPRTTEALAHQDPALDPYRYVEVHVPGEIHDVFQKLGIISDPNFGVNALYSEWVALQYYQYYRTFMLPEKARGKEQWLVFDQLDLVADIYLNGQWIGNHKNVHYPCRLNITGKLKEEGENIITVTLESGLYDVSEKEAFRYGNINGFIQSIDKRHYQRKPQYQFNWDWNPRYINAGITGDVRLEWGSTLRVDQVVITQNVNDDLQKATISVQNFIEGIEKSKLVEITASIIETNQKINKSFPLSLGLNPYNLSLVIEKPQLWWPVGQGNQYRYTLKIDVSADGVLVGSTTKRIGVRKVEVDQSPHPEKGTYFTIKVNNRPVFMKGACWVPADMVYSKVTKEHLDSLVTLAVNANFNMVRIWGGGVYAGNDLLDICDEKGLLVSHDFMFACSIYPYDDISFTYLVRKEITWVVREFSYHPSLIVWMGNNEIEAIWQQKADGKTQPPMADYGLYHHLIPGIIKAEIPTGVFYWPTSPYSGNYENPQSPYFGDQHPWGVSIGKDDVDFRAYREYVDRFADEGGVLGASSPATIRQMLPKDQQKIRSFAWDFHDNLINYWDNELGVSYRSFEFHLGKIYDQVPFNDYLFGSSLLQAEGLQEYINNYRRRKFSSSAAIFWMYNDSWPVTNGWTIVDYYLRKKLAYHPVRRAFGQICVVVAEEGNKINIYGINEKQQSWKGKLHFGLFSTDGKFPVDEFKTVTLPSNTSTVIASFEKMTFEKAGINNHGAFAVLQDQEKIISQHRLFLTRFKDIELLKPHISIKYSNDKAVITAPAYVWGVCVDIDGESEVSDNCFDLLPGIPYTVDIKKGEKVEVKMTGNDLMN
ncbi:MAG: hypothetical protein A2W90_19080 [Bacteroidetes bacterium GWF2_42_66]|nr:MAG: hypothetical protein A2W92_05895 [Bacteroidetes bacterium GWA2_42_15]OFX98726.1 MAG: hypothetical protein A2W89_10610 [Bacteroidetes bacterium GWE2_42_39]OFY43075.1 MAG: hypothetical protein A2W90_19080 [Bacteroidetes bacterium GWF2_42_66]HBL77081.1 hypothetical protein [Prolixibacteraceae bacterium]HCU59865.1 hypothetical protein [Prolixibacteraceae bacterium]